jgi:hypothetical protein
MNEIIQEKENEIINILNSAKGSTISVCKHIYDILHNNPDISSELLQFFLEKYETIKSNEKEIISDYMGENELNSIKEKYGDIVNSFIKKLLLDNLDQKIFYEKVWALIEGDQAFDSEKAKVFALYYFLADQRIPYFQLIDEDIGVTDDEINDVILQNFQDLQKIRFIINTPFLKDMVKTSSALLNILDSAHDKKDKLARMDDILYCIYNQSQEGKNNEE